MPKKKSASSKLSPGKKPTSKSKPVAKKTPPIRQPRGHAAPSADDLADALGALLRSFAEGDDEAPMPRPSRSLSLSKQVPVPGRPGIDDALARSWCAAGLQLLEAAPWNEAYDSELIHAALPGGQSRVVSILGNGGEAFGILLYDSLDDALAMERLSMMPLGGVTSLIQGKVEMPPTLSLNFEPASDCQASHDRYLSQYGPGWSRNPSSPSVLKLSPQGNAATPTPADFAITAAIASALAFITGHMRQKRNWPPNPGTRAGIKVPGIPACSEVTFTFLGEVHFDDEPEA